MTHTTPEAQPSLFAQEPACVIIDERDVEAMEGFMQMMWDRCPQPDYCTWPRGDAGEVQE